MNSCVLYSKGFLTSCMATSGNRDFWPFYMKMLIYNLEITSLKPKCLLFEDRDYRGSWRAPGLPFCPGRIMEMTRGFDSSPDAGL